MQLDYRVDGMTCNSCRMTVIEELEELDGVEGVHVDLDSGAVRVEGDGLDGDAIMAAITEAGYQPSPAA